MQMMHLQAAFGQSTMPYRSRVEVSRGFTMIYGGYKMVYSNGDISKITRVHGLGLL